MKCPKAKFKGIIGNLSMRKSLVDISETRIYGPDYNEPTILIREIHTR